MANDHAGKIPDLSVVIRITIPNEYPGSVAAEAQLRGSRRETDGISGRTTTDAAGERILPEPLVAGESFGAACRLDYFQTGGCQGYGNEASLDDSSTTGQRACCDLPLIRTPGM